MAKVHCFTSANFGYLDRVRVLGATLKAHHPDWELTLCLVDQEPAGWTFDIAREPIDHVVRITELDLPDPPRFFFDHTVVELCTAAKGAMLKRLLADGHEKVIYLDPDIAVFGSLSEAAKLLDRHDILLTPHQLAPETDEKAIRDNELATLKYGMYNLGFIGVANSAEGRRFAQWWSDRLAVYCFDDVPNGIFTDQKWCDFVPSFFPGTYIIRDPGYNVASWNLSQRPITIDDKGTLCAGGSPLKFFHFTKVTGEGLLAIEYYAGDSLETFELVNWYVNALAGNQPDGLPAGYWAYGTYADGSPITAEQRRGYRSNTTLRSQHPNPFVADDAADLRPFSPPA